MRLFFICLVLLISLAQLAMFRIDFVIEKQVGRDLKLLDAAGYHVRIDRALEMDARTRLAESDELEDSSFVTIKVDRRIAEFRGSKKWRSVVKLSDERKWINDKVVPYIRYGDIARAELMMVRYAVIVARDRLSAPIEEPLTPVLFPEAPPVPGRPSQTLIWGIPLATVVFLLGVVLAIYADVHRRRT